MTAPFNFLKNTHLPSNVQYNNEAYSPSGPYPYSSANSGLPSLGSTSMTNGNYAPSYASSGNESPNLDTYVDQSSVLNINSAQDLEQLITATQKLYVTLVKSAQEARDILKQKSNHWKNPALYKTTICDHWRAKRKCKYGVKCWYAHGTQELRYVPRLDQIPSLDSLKGDMGSNHGMYNNFDVNAMHGDACTKELQISGLFDGGQNSNDWTSQQPYVSGYSNLASQSWQHIPTGPQYPFDELIGGLNSGMNHNTGVVGSGHGSTDSDSLISSPEMTSPNRTITPTQQLFMKLTENLDDEVNGIFVSDKVLQESNEDMEKGKSPTGIGLSNRKPVLSVKQEWNANDFKVDTSFSVQIEKPKDDKSSDSPFGKSYRPFDENYPLKGWM